MRRWLQEAWLHDQGAGFRIWAPRAAQVAVLREEDPDAAHPLSREGGGFFSGHLPGLRAGARYRYRLTFPDGTLRTCIDPFCRFAPAGPHGWAELTDPAAFAWSDEAWRGLDDRTPVIYELHIGTFTAEGTFAAAQAALPALVGLGISVIELMPVADFPGRFGWGYDGVLWFAPYHGYGRPDDLKHFINQAHELGIAVILDVVYNHFGPDGNFLPVFADHYLSPEDNEWGRGLNFDGDQSAPARQMVTDNAAYWISEFRFDGLRIDATQCLIDESPDHIVNALTRAARAAASGRVILMVAENEPQDARLLAPAAQGGGALDALWNDDFHHAALVALTGLRHAYFTDYQGRAPEFVAAALHGFLYQGQRYHWQKARRGESTRGLTPDRFVTFLENHDQLANTFGGRRLGQLASRGCHRAMTALLLLGPWMPQLFQGQEWGTLSHFHYFADHPGPLGDLVHQGRLAFLTQFPAGDSPDVSTRVPHSTAAATFEGCRLDWSERAQPAAQESLALHTDLLALRHHDPLLAAFNRRPCARSMFDAAVINQAAFCLRWWDDDPNGPGDRLLLVNLGPESALEVVPEPLLASPPGRRWHTAWSSDHPRYGGTGVVSPEHDDGAWTLPGQGAVFLTAARHGILRSKKA